MYEFVDTTAGSGTGSTSMSIQTIFNNINLDEELTDENGSFTTLTVSGRSNTLNRIKTIPVTGMDGVYEEDNPTIEPREPVIKFRIKDKTNEGFRDRLIKLNSLLVGSKKVLEFTDKDVIFYATVKELDIPEEDSNDLIGFITFLCSDPFKYGPEIPYNFQTDHVVIENKGTAKADPIFELIAKKKSTFAMISNADEEYNLIGEPADDDVVVVDEKVSVLYENGSTIDTWKPATLDMLDSYHIDNIGGSLISDGAGIRADGYGTGEKLHGPAAFREIDPLQDFELETTFDIISERDDDHFRMGIMLHDENMNVIGHLGIKDDSRYFKRRVPLGRVGTHGGDNRTVRNVIGDDNRVDNVTDTTLFYLRMKRVGNTFNFYIGEWRNQRHIRHWDGTYRDVNNEFIGKLKYITIYITNYKDRQRPLRLRITNVEVFELSQATVDQTPNIIYPGDKIEFDHVNNDILLNGESRKDLKAFGGTFFKLAKGENMLMVTPEDTFDVTCRFREKFR